MVKRADFQTYQRQFTEYIRDPIANACPPGVDERRMHVYRDLFYNNLSRLLAKTFPVLRQLHEPSAWQRLVRGFMRDHRAHTPLFLKIPAEFVDYLSNVRTPEDGDFVFLIELAHYEWAELSLSVAEAEKAPANLDPNGDLAAGRPCLSSLAWLLRYRFPVHRIGPSFRPSAASAQPHFLLLHRDANDKVCFLELNLVSARLIELLRDGDPSTSGHTLLQQIAGELQHPNPDGVIAAGLDTLGDFRKRGVIIGTSGEQRT